MIAKTFTALVRRPAPNTMEPASTRGCSSSESLRSLEVQSMMAVNAGEIATAIRKASGRLKHAATGLVPVVFRLLHYSPVSSAKASKPPPASGVASGRFLSAARPSIPAVPDRQRARTFATIRIPGTVITANPSACVNPAAQFAESNCDAIDAGNRIE